MISDCRLGVQSGELQYARWNSVPCRASASRLGVARRGSPSSPSVHAAWSSAMIKSRFGREAWAGSACAEKAVPAWGATDDRCRRGSMDSSVHPSALGKPRSECLARQAVIVPSDLAQAAPSRPCVRRLRRRRARGRSPSRPPRSHRAGARSPRRNVPDRPAF